MIDEGEILLVSSTDWLSQRSETGYHEVDFRQALRTLSALGQRRVLEVREFLGWASVGCHAVCRMDDREIRDTIRKAIQDRRVIAIQKGAAKPDAPNAAAKLRRLVAQIEKETRGKLLAFRGRQYKLVVGNDLARTPNRDSFEVVGQVEARVVLEGVAAKSGTFAKLLREAGEKIGKDWRPPFSEPEGLVLLRRILQYATSSKREAEVATPSQMARLMESVTLEVVVLGLDDKPLDGLTYVIEAPDDENHEGDLGASGKTKITSVKKGSAGVALAWSDAGSSD